MGGWGNVILDVAVGDVVGRVDDAEMMNGRAISTLRLPVRGVVSP